MSEPLPYVHLAIDVQAKYLHALLTKRANAFRKNIRAAAHRLRVKHGIPTIVVGLGDSFKVYASEITNPSREHMQARKRVIRNHGLGLFEVHPTEDIVTKNTNNVFVDCRMKEYLKNAGIKGVIITGMQSSYCVAESAAGAIGSGFDCIVFPDLLADSSHKNFEGDNGGDPAWHERSVRSTMNELVATKLAAEARGEISLHKIDAAMAVKINFVLSDDFLKNPAQFLRAPEPSLAPSPHQDVKAGFAAAL